MRSASGRARGGTFGPVGPTARQAIFSHILRVWRRDLGLLILVQACPASNSRPPFGLNAPRHCRALSELGTKVVGRKSQNQHIGACSRPPPLPRTRIRISRGFERASLCASWAQRVRLRPPMDNIHLDPRFGASSNVPRNHASPSSPLRLKREIETSILGCALRARDRSARSLRRGAAGPAGGYFRLKDETPWLGNGPLCWKTTIPAPRSENRGRHGGLIRHRQRLNVPMPARRANRFIVEPLDSSGEGVTAEAAGGTAQGVLQA